MLHLLHTLVQRPFVMTLFLTATHYPYSSSVKRSDYDEGQRTFDYRMGYIWNADDRNKVRESMRSRYRETVRFVDRQMDRVFAIANTSEDPPLCCKWVRVDTWEHKVSAMEHLSTDLAGQNFLWIG